MCSPIVWAAPRLEPIITLLLRVKSAVYFRHSLFGQIIILIIANHTAINARVIGANEHESHYIFDLLMNNTSGIIPEVLSTDTHGVNHVNFALLDLFGYQFAPRYAQVGKVIQ